MGVKISLHCRALGIPGYRPADALEIARMAEGAGLYGIHLGDHVVMGPRTDRYPYGNFGDHAVAIDDTPWLEPITALAAMSAITTDIRVGINVLLAPLRPGPLLAKSIATLDVLSGGRTEIGVGVGWQREELEALGVEWRRRNHVFEDVIGACRSLWGEQPASYASETVSFEGLTAYPLPVQERVPLLFGVKMTDHTAQVIARDGDGWCPHGVTVGEIRTGLETLRAAYREVGHDPLTIRVRSKPDTVLGEDGRIDIEATFENAAPLVDAGVQILVIPPLTGFDRLQDVGPFLERVQRRAVEIWGA